MSSIVRYIYLSTCKKKIKFYQMYILDDTDCRINLHFAYIKVWKKGISIDRIYFTAFRKRFMETLKDI